MNEPIHERLQPELVGVTFEDAETRAAALEERLAQVFELANAWEAHARSLDPIHKDRASTYQDCADELRERAKGEP